MPTHRTNIRIIEYSGPTLVAIYFDVEKAYDLLWKEGLLIKMKRLGISGKMFRWVKEFLYGCSIEVRVGNTFSASFLVDNGMPQGSVISPLLFSIMIDDVYNNIGQGIGKSLFADDGAMWKRGRNVEYVVKQLQETIKRVEQWSLEWGFKFSAEKTKTLFFTRKKIEAEVKLYLYGKELERVESFKCLGVWFDARLTWKVHIDGVVNKCKKVLNVMRCLVGSR